MIFYLTQWSAAGGRYGGLEVRRFGRRSPILPLPPRRPAEGIEVGGQEVGKANFPYFHTSIHQHFHTSILPHFHPSILASSPPVSHENVRFVRRLAVPVRAPNQSFPVPRKHGETIKPWREGYSFQDRPM